MKRNKSGIIYLVHAQGTSRYKLGITSQPMEKYIKSLQSRSPFQLAVVHTIKAKNYHQVESHLHRQFKNKQVKIEGSKEWFSFNPWQINFEVKPAMNRYKQLALAQYLPSMLELGGLMIAAFLIAIVLN